VKELVARSNIMSFFNLLILKGRLEVKRHLDNLSVSIFVNSPIPDGNCPPSNVLETSSLVRDVRFLSSLGRLPSRKVSNKYNRCKLLRRPNDEGIEPVITLLYKYKYCRLLRPPSEEGIEPVIDVLDKAKY